MKSSPIPVRSIWNSGAPARALAVLAGLAAFPFPVTAAPSLEAFVLSLAGVSHVGGGPYYPCSTFGHPVPPCDFFFCHGVSIPTEGLATCGVAGDFEDATALTGPISRSRNFSTSWSYGASGTFDGTAYARSNYGALSADGHSNFAGTTGPFSLSGSEGLSRCNDAFTITSPSVSNGQTGTVRFLVTIAGALSTTAAGTGAVELNYQYGASIYTMFKAQVSDAISAPQLSSIFGAGLAGFTAIPGSVSGGGQTTTFAHSITFGTPFDFNFGLFAYTIPGAPSTVESHFQAYVSGIEVTGPGGGAIVNFNVVTGSGTIYGPTGVSAAAGPPREGEAVRLAASPNPSAIGTRLSYRMPQTTRASLEIYDSSGRMTRRLFDGPIAHSESRATWWDGRDDRGAKLPSGTYYARLRWDDGSRTTRVTLVH